MPLPPGTRLGSYEILAALGSGGMGDVYRARDARLNRDVAIKVLPDRLVHDPVALARFEREAQAVAALSHPNILAIYDFAHDNGGAYAVTELLDGHTLRSRLGDGAMPARKAVEIAIGVARGIAAAHERGIIHRDLKPENIFLTTDGVVKILDFGLARPVEGNASSTVQASSETRMSLTGEGTVLGTAGYMAPEQVRGQPLDARTDLFALGIVLHEMLTGTRPFHRDTAADTMTAILKDDPPDVPASRSVSPALERIVRHCLEKLPAERFQTARDVAFALESLSGSQSAPAVARGGANAMVAASGETRGRSAWRERSLWVAATTIATAVAAWFAVGAPAGVPADDVVVRTNIQIPGNYIFRTATPPARRLAVSPDNKHVAFAVAGRGAAETELFIYSFETGSLVSVPDSRSAIAPFWSPDGTKLAFVQGNRLMTVDAAGGRPTPRAVAIGGTGDWSRDGDIVSLDTSGRFLSVLPRGSSEWRKIEGAGSGPERYATYPVWLPDGRRFIFGVGGPDAPPMLHVGSVAGSAWKPVLPINLERESSNFMYVAGYLIGMRDRMIVARPFNPDAPDENVEPVVLGGPVDSSARGSAAFSISDNLLVYQPVADEAATRLQWYEMNGAKLAQLADDTGYSNPELSPDGSQLLVGILDPVAHTRDIWVVDVNRGVRSRLTSDPNVDERSAVWGSDNTWFVYRGANRDLYRRPIGAGTPQPLIVDGRSKDPRMFTRDGKFFIYRVSGDGTSNDIWVKPIVPDGPPRPLIATAFNESYADVSPDGKWLVYVSDESQQPAVFLTSFPNGSGKWRVSPAGGNVPRWSHDGRELYFLDDDRVLMRASVTASGDSIQVGAATPLFQTAADRGPGPQFVVTHDGKRVLVNTEIATGAPEVLTVVTNWQALLRRKQ